MKLETIAHRVAKAMKTPMKPGNYNINKCPECLITIKRLPYYQDGWMVWNGELLKEDDGTLLCPRCNTRLTAKYNGKFTIADTRKGKLVEEPAIVNSLYTKHNKRVKDVYPSEEVSISEKRHLGPSPVSSCVGYIPRAKPEQINLDKSEKLWNTILTNSKGGNK